MNDNFFLEKNEKENNNLILNNLLKDVTNAQNQDRETEIKFKESTQIFLYEFFVFELYTPREILKTIRNPILALRLLDFPTLSIEGDINREKEMITFNQGKSSFFEMELEILKDYLVNEPLYVMFIDLFKGDMKILGSSRVNISIFNNDQFLNYEKIPPKPRRNLLKLFDKEQVVVAEFDISLLIKREYFKYDTKEEIVEKLNLEKNPEKNKSFNNTGKEDKGVNVSYINYNENKKNSNEEKLDDYISYNYQDNQDCKKNKIEDSNYNKYKKDTKINFEENERRTNSFSLTEKNKINIYDPNKEKIQNLLNPSQGKSFVYNLKDLLDGFNKQPPPLYFNNKRTEENYFSSHNNFHNNYQININHNNFQEKKNNEENFEVFYDKQKNKLLQSTQNFHNKENNLNLTNNNISINKSNTSNNNKNPDEEIINKNKTLIKEKDADLINYVKKPKTIPNKEFSLKKNKIEKKITFDKNYENYEKKQKLLNEFDKGEKVNITKSSIYNSTNSYNLNYSKAEVKTNERCYSDNEDENEYIKLYSRIKKEEHIIKKLNPDNNKQDYLYQVKNEYNKKKGNSKKKKNNKKEYNCSDSNSEDENDKNKKRRNNSIKSDNSEKKIKEKLKNKKFIPKNIKNCKEKDSEITESYDYELSVKNKKNKNIKIDKNKKNFEDEQDSDFINYKNTKKSENNKNNSKKNSSEKLEKNSDDFPHKNFPNKKEPEVYQKTAINNSKKNQNKFKNIEDNEKLLSSFNYIKTESNKEIQNKKSEKIFEISNSNAFTINTNQMSNLLKSNNSLNQIKENENLLLKNQENKFVASNKSSVNEKIESLQENKNQKIQLKKYDSSDNSHVDESIYGYYENSKNFPTKNKSEIMIDEESNLYSINKSMSKNKEKSIISNNSNIQEEIFNKDNYSIEENYDKYNHFDCVKTENSRSVNNLIDDEEEIVEEIFIKHK